MNDLIQIERINKISGIEKVAYLFNNKQYFDFFN